MGFVSKLGYLDGGLAKISDLVYKGLKDFTNDNVRTAIIILLCII